MDSQIFVGYRTEHGLRPVPVAQIGDWLAAHPGWVTELRVWRPDHLDAEYYVPAGMSVDAAGVLVWQPNDTDTQYEGKGRAQLWARDPSTGNTYALYDVSVTVIRKAITSETITPPDPMIPYIDALLNAAAETRLNVDAAKAAQREAEQAASASAASASGAAAAEESASESARKANKAKDDAAQASGSASSSASSAASSAAFASSAASDAIEAAESADADNKAAHAAMQAAQEAAQAAEAAQTAAGNSAGAAAQSDQQAAQSAEDARKSAKAAAESAVDVAKAVADGVSTIETQTTSSVQTVNNAAMNGVNAVQDQQAASIVKVQEAQQAAEQAVQEKTEDQLARIPEVTELAATTTQLKDDLANIQTATTDDVGKALKAKTVTDGKVTEWEFGEAGGGSADLSEIIDIGKNLFDKSKAKLNTVFSGDTRAEAPQANMAVSAHITVTPGETISFTKANPTVEVRMFTDAVDSAYKGRGTHTVDGDSCHFVVPIDVKSIRINFTNYDNIPEYNYIDRMMVNRGETLLPYEPYGKKVLASSIEVAAEQIIGLHSVAKSGSYLDLSNTPTIDRTVTAGSNNAVSSNAVIDYVTQNTPALTRTRNIFDISKIHDEGSYYFKTGMMEVEADTDYIMFNQVSKTVSANMNTSYAYDENGNKIGALGDGMTWKFHTPANAKYVDLEVGAIVKYKEYLMIEKGTEPSWVFEPYGYKEHHFAFFNSYFYGKKYVAIGDSNTDTKEYPAFLAWKLGMYYNPAKTSVGGCECGRGGATYWIDATKDAQEYSTTSAICAASRVETLPEDAEIITMAGASNDAGQMKELGNPDTDITMYYVEGAVNSSTPSDVVHVPYTDVPDDPNFYNSFAISLNRVRQRCPNADIFICEIPFRSMGAYETSGTVREDFFQPYREAQEKIAKKYGYPFIGTHRNLGVNEINWKTYLNSSDTDYGIHFNIDGNKLLAREMASEMLSVRR